VHIALFRTPPDRDIPTKIAILQDLDCELRSPDLSHAPEGHAVCHRSPLSASRERDTRNFDRQIRVLWVKRHIVE
jgi:hypothetical protein